MSKKISIYKLDINLAMDMRNWWQSNPKRVCYWFNYSAYWGFQCYIKKNTWIRGLSK